MGYSYTAACEKEVVTTGFFYFEAHLMTATFMSMLDDGDIYIHAPSQRLHALDTVYQGAQRFTTTCNALNQNCSFIRWFLVC